MKTVDRSKVCPNCDGRVAHEVSQCPYCFTTLQVENVKASVISEPHTEKTQFFSKGLREGQETASAEESPSVTRFFPLFLLVVGGNLCTLGVLQFLFSDHGVLHLEINGSYWFLLILMALPMLYLGIKNLNKVI